MYEQKYIKMQTYTLNCSQPILITNYTSKISFMPSNKCIKDKSLSQISRFLLDVGVSISFAGCSSTKHFVFFISRPSIAGALY
jgi:hypothetical protein